MADLETVALPGKTIDLTYVVQVAAPDPGSRQRTQQRDFVTLLSEGLSTDSGHNWHFMFLNADFRTSRVAGPIPADMAYRTVKGSRVGVDFSLGQCAEDLVRYTNQISSALARRGAVPGLARVLFLAVSEPLLDVSGAEALDRLRSAVDSCTWITFYDADEEVEQTVVSDYTWHADLAEEVLDEVFMGPPHARNAEQTGSKS